MSRRRLRVEAALPVGLQGFYNLPSDEARRYPQFSSFQDRESFIRSSMLESPEFRQGLERIVASDTEIASALASGPSNHDDDDMWNKAERKGTVQWAVPTVLQLADHKQLSEIVFVGSSTGLFSPQRGDLIIYPPGKNSALCEKGYVASYEGRNSHRFEHGELLVRIGQYQEVGSSGLFSHQPYTNLELHQYKVDGRWTYLGSQVAMTNLEIPGDTSPGKYLKVGAQIVCVDRFHPIIPRRGDIIIKREVWDETFFHQENFRRSMVKWHRDRQITWKPGDLLIRLFVDKEKCPPSDNYVYNTTPDPGDHSACVLHKKCTESHPPPSSGFAELYECKQGAVEWVYWGRAKLLFDIPVQNSPEDRDPHLAFYITDDGQLSDFDLEEDNKRAP